MFRNLKPVPECMSLTLKILPPGILSKKIVVACATCGFLLLAPTAMPVTGARVSIVGLRKEF